MNEYLVKIVNFVCYKTENLRQPVQGIHENCFHYVC